MKIGKKPDFTGKFIAPENTKKQLQRRGWANPDWCMKQLEGKRHLVENYFPSKDTVEFKFQNYKEYPAKFIHTRDGKITEVNVDRAWERLYPGKFPNIAPHARDIGCAFRNLVMKI